MSRAEQTYGSRHIQKARNIAYGNIYWLILREPSLEIEHGRKTMNVRDLGVPSVTDQNGLQFSFFGANIVNLRIVIDVEYIGFGKSDFF